MSHSGASSGFRDRLLASRRSAPGLPARRLPAFGFPASGVLVVGFLAVVLLPVLLSCCASYTTRMRALRTSVSGGNLEKALELVGEKGEPGDLLYHLERGALLHYLDRYAESNGDLESAEQVLDERYTVSLSERGLTFLLNDEIEAYAGEVHEGNYLHYYRTLNFLAREERAAAAVEARRLALRLSELRERQSEDLSVRDDPFLEYLAGAVLESVGEWNGALISYRLAKSTYAEWEREAARPVFPWLEQDIVRTARLSGIDLREIGLVPAERDRAADASTDGQLLVLFECGWTPRKVSKHLRIPIFECDRGGDGGARGDGDGVVPGYAGVCDGDAAVGDRGGPGLPAAGLA